MNNQSTEPLVSFIILGWNNKALLEECFDSIQKQNYKNRNIVYVDNGSSDGSLDYVKEQYPEIIRVDNGKNLGFAIGNNIGIKKALENQECKYVALLNTDARIDKDWLQKLVGFALEHPKGAAFQSPTFDYYNHSILDSRGLLLDHQGRAIQLGYRDKSPALETKRVFGVNAAAALFSKDFLAVQPFGDDYFDSDMWMYLEDVDIAARATIMGWENWFVNQSRAYHMGSASTSSNPGFSVFMSYRNNAYLIVKNFPISMIIRIIPGLVATDIESIYRNMRGKNYIATKAMIRARVYSLFHLGKFISKRSALKGHWAVSKKDVWRLMSDK